MRHILLVALLAFPALEAAAKPPAPPKAEVKPRRPTKIDELDALRLRVAAAELAEQIARRDTARLAFEAAERSIGPLNDELMSARHVFETKYGLDLTHDRFDVRTLEIQWAEPAPSAKGVRP